MPDRDPCIIKHWRAECQVWKPWKKGNRPHKNERTQILSFFPSSNVYCIFFCCLPSPCATSFNKNISSPSPSSTVQPRQGLDQTLLQDHGDTVICHWRIMNWGIMGRKWVRDGLQSRGILWILIDFTCLFLCHQMENIRILTLQSLWRQRNCGDWIASSSQVSLEAEAGSQAWRSVLEY